MEWNLKTYGGAVYKGYLWFSNNVFNGLFRMNIDIGNIEFIDFFPNERRDVVAAHKKCIYYNGKLFFLPARANNIHIYDIEQQKFNSIPIERNDREFCADAALVDEKIYILSLNPEQDLLVLDTQNLQLDKRLSFKSVCVQAIDSNDTNFLLCRCTEYEKKIYFAFCGTDMVVSYDILKENFATYHTGVEDIFSCFIDDGICWIITKHTGDIYQYDFKSKPLLMFSEEKLKDNNRRFNQIFKYNDRTWILPAYPGPIVCFDQEGNKAIYDNFVGEDPAYILFFGSVFVKNEQWLLPFRLNCIYVIDENMKLNKQYSFTLKDKESKGRILAGFLKEKDEPMREYGGFGLPDFLDVIDLMEEENNCIMDFVGDKIYNTCL